VNPDEFISLVAHELKTPLTPLKSVAQLVRLRMRKAKSGEKPLDLDALEKSLASIERQVDRMDRLVTDLLEVSRMGRGTFQLRRAQFDLAASVRSVAQKWTEAAAEEGRHTIEVDAPATLLVECDQGRIEQVLHGLIGNAVKFSPRGGRVGVRLGVNGEIRLAVSDDGIGIPADEVAVMASKPFTRGQRAQGYAGVGVGLYLARLIAEGHGGRLELASPGEDQGTTASLILPR
jgi:signal transduction histidine kinase